MPTIIFDDSFTPKERIILTKTFKANCDRLDIKQRDCTVMVRRENIGTKAHQGCVTRLHPDHFVVVLNSNGFNLFEGISVLGHETVHIAQYLRGDLDDKKDGGCIWKGNHYPDFMLEAFYRDLPWEVEAFEHQPKLHKHALHILAPVDMSHVIVASRHAFE